MSKFDQKIEWLKHWSDQNDRYLDVMNSQLVDEYCEAHNVKVSVMPFGANICRDLGRTLSKGYKMGLLDRGVVGLTQMETGFPKWVYVYNFK